MGESIHDYSARTITGETLPLSVYAGRVCLIVNVASQCGFTPQYRGLEALYRRLEHRGLTVLGFPCNQFGRQEPGDETAIREFCSLNFGVSFPLFARIDVNGPSAHPLYRYLTSRRPGLLGTRSIKWNFTKFLVDRSGVVRGRYGPSREPSTLEPEIVRLLDQ
ncbi:MAG TPA: glutathione peroxidase [Gemmatimonadales bacterium]|nr:glutathione peroxidase [Gemmatimonadales bacterium]